MKRTDLIQKLNRMLKEVSDCSEEEIELQGEKIREVFFTMMEQNFTIEEIEKVFEGVSISDEKIALIEEKDNAFKK